MDNFKISGSEIKDFLNNNGYKWDGFTKIILIKEKEKEQILTNETFFDEALNSDYHVLKNVRSMSVLIRVEDESQTGNNYLRPIITPVSFILSNNYQLISDIDLSLEWRKYLLEKRPEYSSYLQDRKNKLKENLIEEQTK